MSRLASTAPRVGVARNDLPAAAPGRIAASGRGRAHRRAPLWRRWRWWAAVGVAAAVAVSGIRRAQPGTSTSSPTVTVRRGTIVRSVVATGKIEPKSKVEVKTRVSGIVKAIRVDAGDAVSEGQIIAELDEEVASARVDEARAALAAARALVGRANAEVNSAERDFMSHEYVRFQTLRAEGVISDRELARARLDADLARSRHESAVASQVEASAQVQRAQAVLTAAENELRYATIVAPIAGTVLARHVDVGAGVSAVGSAGGFASTLMTIGDVGELRIVGQVDEVEIGEVVPGLPARIRVDALRGRTFPGAVTSIAPQGNEKDKVVSFEVEVTVPNDATGLRPMMTADAEIVVAEAHDVLLVPEAAIVRDTGATFVERPVGRDGRVRVPVRLGISSGAEVEVAGGLAEGDVVVGP